MRKEVLPIFLAAGLALATVGSASCQRPPETPDVEATVQARVRATLTAGSGQVEPAATPAPLSEEKPEKGWVIFKNPLGLYKIQYPESWKSESTNNGYDVFFNPSSNREYPVQFNVFPEPINPGVNPQAYLDASIKQLNQWLIQKGHDGYSLEKIEKKSSAKIDQGVTLKANQIQGSVVKFDQRIALLIAKSSLWKISFAGTSPLSTLDEETFNRAIKTFVPLQSSLSEQPAQQAARPAEAQKPAQESKEKEPIHPLVLLPIKITESKHLDFSFSDYVRLEDFYRNPESIRAPQPGWKYVYVELAVENKGSRNTLVRLDLFNQAVLHDKDGFQYKSPQPSLTFELTRSYFGTGYQVGIHENLPPGFRVIGVFSESAHPDVPNDKTSLTSKVTFKVGEQTSGYKLKIPQFPEVNLDTPVKTESLRFPTDRPDSEFKELGTTINIPGKGRFTVEGVIDRRLFNPKTAWRGWQKEIPNAGSKVKLRLRFHNDSKGYGQTFNIVMGLFGEDGILYTSSKQDGQIQKIFPNNPLFWSGYFVTSGEIAPGQDRTVDQEITTSSRIKSGKLVVAGDINEIFNVRLPLPR